MPEKNQKREEKPEPERADGTRSASERKRKKTAPGSTLQSWEVELSARRAASLTYWGAPPSSPYNRPPEEPSKKVPIVPPGDFESDADDSPPVQFENPDDTIACEACSKNSDQAHAPDDDASTDNH